VTNQNRKANSAGPELRGGNAYPSSLNREERDHGNRIWCVHLDGLDVKQQTLSLTG
jgi:hypothetical protein